MEPHSIILWWQALVLGIVEGVTEYLPISSTGHLVLASDWLGLRDLSQRTPAEIEAIQSFEIVIQGGAILAVAVLYYRYLINIGLGILGKSVLGKKLFYNMVIATLPILSIGYLAKGVIAKYLQFTGPVLIALVTGGVVMILFERMSNLHQLKVGNEKSASNIYDLTYQQALLVGFIQCLALWPGTSRSMVTIIAGLCVGLSRPAAAEFSFLIGLPALIAATLYKSYKSGAVLIEHVGESALMIGLFTSFIFAVLAIKWLIAYLSNNGLKVFGWYRIVLAMVIYMLVDF